MTNRPLPFNSESGRKAGQLSGPARLDRRLTFERPPGERKRPFDSAAISQAKSTTTLPYGRPGTLWKKNQSFDRADRPSP